MLHYCNGDAANPIVYGLSKTGRMVKKYTCYKRLTNFRAAWIPDNWVDKISYKWETKEEANEHAKRLSEIWSVVRFFNRDGTTILRDGVTESEALRQKKPF